MSKAEKWYVWRELVTVEGESEPRLLVPWSDPHQYEWAADGLYDTAEDAEAWRKDIALDIDEAVEDWVLCLMTVQPVQ